MTTELVSFSRSRSFVDGQICIEAYGCSSFSHGLGKENERLKKNREKNCKKILGRERERESVSLFNRCGDCGALSLSQEAIHWSGHTPLLELEGVLVFAIAMLKETRG